MSAYYQELDRSLRAVLADLGDESLSVDWTQVVEFIDVGEYGLALESLADTVVNGKTPLPRSVFTKISKLADTMGIRSSVITKELADIVVAER